MELQEFKDKYIERKKNYDSAYSKLSDSTKEYISTAHLLVDDLFSDMLVDLKNLNGETVKRRELIDFATEMRKFTKYTQKKDLEWIVDRHLKSINE